MQDITLVESFAKATTKYKLEMDYIMTFIIQLNKLLSFSHFYGIGSLVQLKFAPKMANLILRNLDITRLGDSSFVWNLFFSIAKLFPVNIEYDGTPESISTGE